MSLLDDLLSAPAGSAFDVAVGQVQLTAEVNAYLAHRTSYPARDVHIELDGEWARIGATVDLLGGRVRVFSVARPRLQKGRLDFDLQELSLNGKAAPAALRWVIVHGVRRLLDPSLMPVAVDRLDLSQGSVRIAGRVTRNGEKVTRK